MAQSLATRTATLRMHLKGVDPAYRAGATQYLALLSLATPDPADPLASELTYTGYARLPITKGTAWTEVDADTFQNAALVQFGKRTDAGATQTIRAFAVVDTASGAVAQAIYGELDDPLDVNLNIQPQFGAGQLEVSGV
jgi:hypothetical protein